MALTMADLEDAQMNARERVRQFKQEYYRDWYRPLRETLLGGMWKGMPPQMRQFYDANHPDAAAAMDKRYKRGK
jgi:DNA-binding transcriptional regulator YbjK